MSSQRQLRDAALEESAEDLYENAPCGYLSTAPDGTIVKVNRTLLEWTGYERGDLVGRRRFRELLTPGGQIYHETHYAPLLRMQGVVREIAVDIVRADGDTLPVLINSALKQGDDGAPLVTRTTLFNATDRKLYEQELLRARELERAVRERVERLQAMTGKLAASLSPRQIAETVADALVEDLDTVNVTVAELDDSRRALCTLWELGPAPAKLPEAIEVSSIVPTFEQPPQTGAGARALLPLRGSADPIGVLFVELADGRELSGEEWGFIVACAGQAAQALERGRLHEEVRHVAHALQQSMLAGAPPSDPRFEVAARYLPGVETLEVGGDWHDAFMVGTERVGVVVGDVVGRGLEAASAMGQLRSAARALALAETGPAQLVHCLDRFVARLATAQMATLAYCEIDLSTGTACYCCAGHPPPVIARPGEEPRLLWEGRSGPLGVHVGPGLREESSVELAPGASLLLYTDGLVERRGTVIDTGLEQLVDEVGRHRGAGAESLVDGIVEAMVDDEAAADDVCLLCLTLTPGG